MSMTEDDVPAKALESAPSEAVVAALRAALEQGGGETQAFLRGDVLSFARFVQQRVPPGADPAAAIEGLHIADLAMVFGCLNGTPEALRAFDSVILGQLGDLLRTPQGAEVRQDLFARLFVPLDPQGPRAARYAGAGSLRGWVRTVAMNLLRSSFRGPRAAPAATSDEELERAVADGGGPEADYVARQGATMFSAALYEGVRELSVRERALLRARYVDGRTIQDLATEYGVHRETLGKWLESARDRLSRSAREKMKEMLASGSREAVVEIDEAIALGVGSLGRLLIEAE